MCMCGHVCVYVQQHSQNSNGWVSTHFAYSPCMPIPPLIPQSNAFPNRMKWIFHINCSAPGASSNCMVYQKFEEALEEALEEPDFRNSMQSKKALLNIGYFCTRTHTHKHTY